MKHCAKCTKSLYCNRECQKAHWKIHKKICAQQAASSSSVPKFEHANTYQTPRGGNLEKHIANPFTRIDQGTYLHDRPEQDVYKLLVDALRMREADQNNMEGRQAANSVWTGAPSSIEGFRTFLGRVERKRGYLPAWWTAEKKKACEEFGEKGDNWSNLRSRVDKADIIAHYGNEKMPMQLRMFAEEALGEPAPGTMLGAGKQMRGMMTLMEGGGAGDDLMYSMMGVDHTKR